MVARFPQRGDVVWLDFSPHSGHEQRGRRPALCISPGTYNNKVGLAIFCPITSQKKGFPFEVPLPEDFPIQGVILADQVKSLDWHARDMRRICSLPAELLAEIIGKLRTLI